MITFDAFKEYILGLEQLEHLFLMYKDFLYSKGEDNTKNLTLWLIKKKYLKIFKKLKTRKIIKHKKYNLKHFKRAALRFINRFLEKYKLKEVVFDLSPLEKKYNVEHKDQLKSLYLAESLNFAKNYLKIIYDEKFKLLVGKSNLNLVRISLPIEGDQISPENDKVICLSCLMECKLNLLKYHLNGKKHKKLSNKSDDIVQVKGDLKEAEANLDKIKEIVARHKSNIVKFNYFDITIVKTEEQD